MSDLDTFRKEARSWLQANCPEGARGPGQIASGSTKIKLEPDVAQWLARMAERGWTAPTWPTEYGGGGLTPAEARVLQDEMARIHARPPLMGMGLAMIGPTLLEFGTADQRQRHLPKIVRGEVQWCQGYSEPGAGSDLASLRTRAQADGDQFVINGQKIWTSGGMSADWMFALVRTDPDAPKHDGISFVLFTMDQPGVTVRPIRLISGNSPFCETFLDNVIASKADLVGELNKGWTVAKRLLQFERSGIGGLSGGQRGSAGVTSSTSHANISVPTSRAASTMLRRANACCSSTSTALRFVSPSNALPKRISRTARPVMQRRSSNWSAPHCSATAPI